MVTWLKKVCLIPVHTNNYWQIIWAHQIISHLNTYRHKPSRMHTNRCMGGHTCIHIGVYTRLQAVIHKMYFQLLPKLNYFNLSRWLTIILYWAWALIFWEHTVFQTQNLMLQKNCLILFLISQYGFLKTLTLTIPYSVLKPIILNGHKFWFIWQYTRKTAVIKTYKL